MPDKPQLSRRFPTVRLDYIIYDQGDFFMHYEGKIYRPWMEASSLLIQTTLGCSNNQCTFGTMFDDKRFSVRDIEDVFKDIEEACGLYRHELESDIAPFKGLLLGDLLYLYWCQP